MTSPSLDESAGPGQDAVLSLARYKELLAEDRHRIRLHDALVAEVQALQRRLGEDQFPVGNFNSPSVEDYLARVDLYDSVTKPVLSIMAAGAYWGGEEHVRLLGRCLARLADPPGNRSGNYALLKLRRYPALLVAYAYGIGAVLSGRYSTLAALLLSTTIRGDDKHVPLVRVLAHNEIIDGEILKRRPELKDHRTPTSDHLFEVLKEPLSALVIDEAEYQAAFDRFEYLYALIHADVYEKEPPLGRIWGPIGCFLWRTSVLREVEVEIAERGNDWSPVKAGLFGGSVERAKQVKQGIDGFVHRNPF